MKLSDKISYKSRFRGLYVLRCNRSIYVGSSINIMHRLNWHRSLLRAGSHTSKSLQAIYDKFGEDSFVVEIVELDFESRSELLKEEERLTLAYREDFDVLNIDNGSSRSLESREKISRTLKGRGLIWSEERLREVAKEKLTIEEAVKKYSSQVYEQARELGIADEIFISKDRKRYKWTLERILEIKAEKLRYIDAHKKYPSGLFKAIRELGVENVFVKN